MIDVLIELVFYVVEKTVYLYVDLEMAYGTSTCVNKDE